MRLLAAALLLAPALVLGASAPGVAPPPAAPAPGAPWPAGPLERQEILAGVLLVHLDAAAASRAPAAIARRAREHLPGVPVVALGKDELPPAGTLSWTRDEPVSWTERELGHFARHVDPSIRGKLTAEHPATFLAVEGPTAGGRTLRAFTKLAGALAADLGAVVFDLESRDLWDPPSWTRLRAGGWDAGVPVVDDHIAIHVYEQDGALRSVTLGMAKLGLPDVVVNGHARSSRMELLVRAVCQWLAENRALPAPGRIPLELSRVKLRALRELLVADLGKGTAGKVDLTVVAGRREEGDAENDLLELSFGGFPGGPTERQAAILTRLFGSADEVQNASADDAALLAASRRAKAALPRFRQGFTRRQPGELFLVKVPFRSARGQVEYMWVEVQSWNGRELRGVLQGEPVLVEGLREGAPVKVAEGEVYDWYWRHADGAREGGETTRILQEREGK